MANEDMTREGGCFCGQVRYRTEGAPHWVLHCHCESCRRSTGAAMVTWVGFKEERFELTAGEPAIHNSSKGIQRGFCPACGTHVTFVSERWPGQVHLLVATLDDPASVEPSGHVYEVERLPWIKLDDGLPRYEATASKPAKVSDAS